MPDTPLSGLGSLSGVNAASNDLMYVVDVSAAAASAHKNISLAELTAALKLIGFTVDDLSDATVTAAAENDVLLYDGAAWSNHPLPDTSVTVDPAAFVNTDGTDVHGVFTDLDAAITSAAGTGIPATIGDAAGDLLTFSAADTPAKLTKGSNYTFLGVNGSAALAYGDPRSVPQTVNTQTGTTYTLVLTDAGKLVTLDNASSITLTVPTAASVAFPAGTVIDIAQYGAGQVTVAGAVPPTIQTSSSLKLRTQWSAASLVLSATANQWFLVGDLEPLGQSINAQTGTTYTFVLADAEKLVTASNGSAQTYTVPPNSTSAFPVGTHIDLIQIGAGQVTIAAGVGVTVNATPTLKARAQYSGMSLVKRATDTWSVVGDMAAS